MMTPYALLSSTVVYVHATGGQHAIYAQHATAAQHAAGGQHATHA